MILELLADSGEKKGSIAFGSPTNIRAALVAPVGKSLGFFISMVVFRAALRADAAFWDVARLVRRQLEAELSRGGQFSMLALMPAIGRLSGVGRLEGRALLERWEKNVPTTTGLTNLGRLGIETRHGPFSIDAFHFSASPSALGDFVGTATSLHGHMYWNFVWPDPVISEAHAAVLTDGIVARLRAAL